AHRVGRRRAGAHRTGRERRPLRGPAVRRRRPGGGGGRPRPRPRGGRRGEDRDSHARAIRLRAPGRALLPLPRKAPPHARSGDERGVVSRGRTDDGVVWGGQRGGRAPARRAVRQSGVRDAPAAPRDRREPPAAAENLGIRRESGGYADPRHGWDPPRVCRGAGPRRPAATGGRPHPRPLRPGHGRRLGHGGALSGRHRLNEKTRDELAGQYLRALEDYLDGVGEAALARAYELGRRAVVDGLGGLEMAALQLEEVRGVLDRIEGEIRTLSHELRPTMLDDLGLVPALQFLAEGVAKRTGLSVEVKGSTHGRLPPAVETALYRVVQEALTNAVRH